MIQRLSRASRRGQFGFTLIELLVVIIVLGILAAVVVFAVTGVGDKGKANAISIDARTIKTAEESFCSQNGRYGTTEELIEARLLSGTPSYNQVILDTSYGPCGNTSYIVGAPPESSLAAAPECQVEAAWCDTPAANGTPSPPNSQNHRIGTTSTGPTPMVVLEDGRILVAKRPTTSASAAACSGSTACVQSFQIFDPRGGAKGAWSSIAPVSSFGGTGNPSPTPANVVSNARVGTNASPGISNMVVIRGNPAWCGVNCGKVLVHMKTGLNFGGSAVEPSPGNTPERFMWKLFDPYTSESGTNSIGSWVPLDTTYPSPPPCDPACPWYTPLPVPGGGPYRRIWNNDFVQLTRTPCGSICGKVLIVGQGGEDMSFSPASAVTPPLPEIWDPAAGPIGSFRKLTDSGYAEGNLANENGSASDPNLTLLNDGRVLMLSGGHASMFDPLTEKFTPVTGPPAIPGVVNATNQLDHEWYYDDAVLLPDGKVLATFNRTNEGSPAAIYQPGPGGGSWTVIPSCGNGTASGDRYCRLLTVLPDGKVLGKRASGTGSAAVPTQLRMLETDPDKPGYLTWAAVPTPSPTTIGNWATVIPEKTPGSCGNLCNKVFAVEIGSLTSGALTRVYSP